MSKTTIPGQVVYLCGAMSGLPFEEARIWRDKATTFLQRLRDPRTKEPLYHILNPLRGHVDLRGQILTSVYTEASAEKIDIRRDRYDVMRSNIVLANLADSEKINRVSIGSVFEIAWAADLEKFLIVVMTPSNPHWHSFVKDAASIVLSDLDSALNYMRDTLNIGELEDVK